MILLMTFFGSTWLTITVILAIISLLVLGYLYDENVDGDGFIALKAVLAIAASIFWPICIVAGICVLIVAAPIYLGKRMKQLIASKKEKLKEKENFFNELEKIKKKGG